MLHLNNLLDGSIVVIILIFCNSNSTPKDNSPKTPNVAAVHRVAINKRITFAHIKPAIQLTLHSILNFYQLVKLVFQAKSV